MGLPITRASAALPRARRDDGVEEFTSTDFGGCDIPGTSARRHGDTISMC